ncbi:MAG: DUF3822 family protein [Tannerella sp.]|jgi:hypothetical protein|nr:DUF3822 family protein [Tannerella sp.]
MNLRVPDTLTAGNSEEYIVSIRLRPGGLSFTGLIPSKKESFFHTEIAIDPTKPSIREIKDIFFAHPFFAYSFRQTFVVWVNRQYTLIPASVFVESQKEQLMSFVFSSPEEKILHERLDEFDSEILYGIQPEVHKFFSRSLLRVSFVHTVSPLLKQWRRQSLIAFPKQLFVAIHEDTMDAACFYRDNLLFSNSFQVDDAADMIYYIMYIWKQTEMDQQNDKLFLHAHASTYQTLKDTIQSYIMQVEFVQSVWPGTALEVPPDILALFTCES